MLTTILIFIIILGILVFVHEFGHFIVAKKSGMVVHEFGFGFPPRLVGVKKLDGKWKVVWGHQKSLNDQELNQADENTLYSINSIPLGGFVRIMGENNEHGDNPKSFINKAFWPRFFTLIAGVTMNWLLAAIIFSIIFLVGFPIDTASIDSIPQGAILSNKNVQVAEVLPGSPAEKAGIKVADQIIEIDNQKVNSSDQFRNYLFLNKGKIFEIQIKRGNNLQNISVESLQNPGKNEGPTGMAIVELAYARLPFFRAFYSGFGQTIYFTKEIFSGLGKLFYSRSALNQVGGPYKIAQLVGQARQFGFMTLANLVAFISLNLAIFNLLPIPALDGGRILFLLIEKIRGKKNNARVEQLAISISMMLLICLVIIVTFKDIRG